MHRFSIIFPFALALLSGMCALVYEIIWMRAFIPLFGLSVHSTTTVLVSFMAGLGIGSCVAPRVISAWRGSLWTLYCFLEIGIASTAVAVPFLTPQITSVYLAVAQIDGSDTLVILTRFGLSVALMILPSLCMGLTLPVLVHAVRDVQQEDPISGRRIGALYGLNTLGGALGCIVVGFFLMEAFGVRTSSLLTGAMNLTLAIGAFLFGKMHGAHTRQEVGQSVTARSESVASEPAVVSRSTILLLYGLIGFVAFGYELCWFRILIFYLQSATYSFSVMLALFLAGIGLGSLYYSAVFEKRLKHVETATIARTLGIIQVLLGVIGITALHIYRDLGPVWYMLVHLLGAESWGIILFQKVIIAGLIIIPPTILMGITFPLVAALYKSHRVADSMTLGHLYAANTLGAILGSLVTGFVFFNTIGVQATITLMSFLSFAIGMRFAWTALRERRQIRFLIGFLGVLLVGIEVATPSRMLIAHFEQYLGKVIFYRESASDITYVAEQGGHRAIAFNDGRGTSSTSPINNYVNRILAYSAMVANPDAKDILVISMGAGNTASAFTKFPIRKLDIVDISSGPFEAAKYFYTNENVIEDPRVTTVVEDGRNYLLKTKNTYDVIQLELPSIHTDGVVNLYTREFYEIVESKLNDKGVLSQWIDALQAQREPSYMLLNTMYERFPNMTVWVNKWSWWGNGRKQTEPPTIDFKKVQELFSDPKIVADMKVVNTSLEDVLSKIVASGSPMKSAFEHAEVITDDKSIVDFLVPRLDSPYALGGGVAYVNSPLRPLFLRRWSEHGSEAMKNMDMFSFYASNHQAKVDESFLGVIQNFPEEVTARVLELNDSQ